MSETPVVADEVVTKAIVRYLDLPFGAGPAAMITLDNGFDHTKPNSFGPGGLKSIDEALDEVSTRTDLAAVCLTGKPFIFAVGADLTAVPQATERSQALALGKEGHRVFNRFSELTVPTFAFINGAAMGGGLEIALHCNYRSISADAAAIALPECFLGLVPGWGGTYLVPNLIGADKAVTVIIANARADCELSHSALLWLAPVMPPRRRRCCRLRRPLVPGRTSPGPNSHHPCDIRLSQAWSTGS